MIAPMPVIRNAGPEHTQNNIICSACEELSFPLSYNSLTHFAPTGYPPTKLSIIAAAASPGSENNILVIGAKGFTSISETPERIMNEDIIIKGSRDGINSVEAYCRPLIIPPDTSEENISIHTARTSTPPKHNKLLILLMLNTLISSPDKIYAASDFYIYTSIKFMGWYNERKK